MSKLVVKIRDDDKYFQHCPLQHEGYCHLPQTHCWSGDGNTLYMMECLGTINKRPPWCPLKEEVKAIPIEWVNMWLENNSKTVRNPDFCGWEFTEEPIDYYVTIYPHEVKRMLNDWEKENGRSK